MVDIRRLLEDLDAQEMNDDVALEGDMDIVAEIEACVLAYDDEGNLVPMDVSANDFLVEYGISQDELEAMIKESGEPLRLFKATPKGHEDVEEYGLYIGNEACTAEDVEARFISNLGDDEEMEFDISEIEFKEEPEDDNGPSEKEIPTEEQLREGWGDGEDYVYYCVSDGVNPRKSIIIPDGDGAKEKAIAHAEANKDKYKYVSRFENGIETVIWRAPGFEAKGMRIGESVKVGPDNLFGYINGGLEDFDPEALVNKAKDRKASIHTNRMVKDTDDVKVCHHIVVDLSGYGDDPHVWVDVVEDTWTRNPGDPDDINSYYGTNSQERILMKDCGIGEEGFKKAIEELGKYKEAALGVSESLQEEYKFVEDIIKSPEDVTNKDLLLKALEREYPFPDEGVKDAQRQQFAKSVGAVDHEDLPERWCSYIGHFDFSEDKPYADIQSLPSSGNDSIEVMDKITEWLRSFHDYEIVLDEPAKNKNDVAVRILKGKDEKAWDYIVIFVRFEARQALSTHYFTDGLNKPCNGESCELEESKLPYHVLAWRLNEIISSMDNEEAYYGGWLYIWPDGETKEDCKNDFSSKEDYEDLLDAFKRYYKEYHKDGLYTDDKRILGYAREMDKKLGLEPIENHGKAQLESLDESKFSKADEEAIAKWWKDVEALGKYKIDNGDYSDIEAMHSAMFDMLSELAKEEGKDAKRLLARGKRLYNKHAISQFNESKQGEGDVVGLESKFDKIYATLDSGETFTIPSLRKANLRSVYIIPIDSKNWDGSKPSKEEFVSAFKVLYDKYKSDDSHNYVIGTYHNNSSGRYSIDISKVLSNVSVENALSQLPEDQEEMGAFDAEGKYFGVENPKYKAK